MSKPSLRAAGTKRRQVRRKFARAKHAFAERKQPPTRAERVLQRVA